MQNQTRKNTRRIAGARTSPADRLIGNSGVSLNSLTSVLAFAEHAMGQIKTSLPVKIGRHEIRTMREFRAVLKNSKDRQVAAMRERHARVSR